MNTSKCGFDLLRCCLLFAGEGPEEFRLKYSQMHAGASPREDMAIVSCV